MGCSRMRKSKKTLLSEICHTYPTMMTLGTVIPSLKSKKYINHVTHPSNFADISIFSTEISNFCYIKKYRNRLHFNTHFLILLTSFEFLKVALINMVVTLMMPAKLATLGLIKIKVFWKKGYNFIISFHNVINMREVIITSTL